MHVNSNSIGHNVPNPKPRGAGDIFQLLFFQVGFCYLVNFLNMKVYNDRDIPILYIYIYIFFLLFS